MAMTEFILSDFAFSSPIADKMARHTRNYLRYGVIILLKRNKTIVDTYILYVQYIYT